MNKLDALNKDRYFCSTFLKEIKEEGQLKLLNSKVVVVGAGGLGSHILPLLVSSGVGFISVIDDDVISISNLPRQTLFDEKDVGKKKANAAKRKLSKLNSGVIVKTHITRLNKSNASRLLKGFDIVIDATDNFETKFLINDVCVKNEIPFVCSGVSDFKGQVMTYIPNESIDFKSLFSELPVNIEQKYIDEDQGVYPPAVAVIGNIAASETIKYLIGNKSLLSKEMLIVDLLDYNFHKIKLVK